MTDLGAVCNDLLSRHGIDRDDGYHRATLTPSHFRLGAGTYGLDYGDDDRMFILTVQQIARRRLGPADPRPIGRLTDDIEVRLTGVVLDVFVNVELDAPQTRQRETVFSEYQAAFDEWAKGPKDPDDLPPQPGERLLAMQIEITDDLGTVYRFSNGQAGGSNTEWQARRSFRPAPPVQARQLRVLCRTPDGGALAAEFEL